MTSTAPEPVSGTPEPVLDLAALVPAATFARRPALAAILTELAETA